MPTTTDMPLDVKLMALATQLLLGVFALLALGALGPWAVRHPAWTVKGISVHGDVAHQNAVGLRAQLATQMRSRLSSSFLTVDLRYPNGYALRVRGVTTTNDQATPNKPSNR